MEGLVLKSTGSHYEVLDAGGGVHNCIARGKLRLQGLKTTNPIAVGDLVTFQEGVISNIHPRKNYIVRKSVKKKSQSHIIAANIDQAILMVTLTRPRTSLGFIDRFLVTAEAFRIPQVIIFNKIDLLEKNEMDQLEAIVDTYQKIGIQCLVTTLTTEKGIEKVTPLLENKKSVLSGHSGVGKSTLLNALDTNIRQKTGGISNFAQKGIHTTTFAEMFELKKGTFIIDTPGIKELGLMDMEMEEISDYFPEMRAIQEHCKFHNCTHIHEPDCAIQTAVDEGLIAESRYNSYLSMILGEDNRR